MQSSASGNVAENPLESSMTLKTYRKFGELLCRKRTEELDAVMARTKTLTHRAHVFLLARKLDRQLLVKHNLDPAVLLAWEAQPPEPRPLNRGKYVICCLMFYCEPYVITLPARRGRYGILELAANAST